MIEIECNSPVARLQAGNGNEIIFPFPAAVTTRQFATVEPNAGIKGLLSD